MLLLTDGRIVLSALESHWQCQVAGAGMDSIRGIGARNTSGKRLCDAEGCQDKPRNAG